MHPTTSIIQTRNPLLQTDLLHYILDHLEAILDRCRLEIRHQTLFALAQTCRALSGPSLDRLWRKLWSLAPLAQYARLVLNKDPKENIPLSLGEWVNIRRYSHRIRELRFDTLDPDSLWLLQATRSRPSLLLPNLTTLFWNLSGAENYPKSLCMETLQQLLGPSLVSLEFYPGDMEDATVRSFFVQYPHRCPNLKSVTIYHDLSKKLSRTANRSLSESLSLHGCVERLNLDVAINDITLARIIMSEKFKGLKLNLSHRHFPRVQIPGDIIPFPNVHELSLATHNPGFVTALLRTESQVFRSFELQLCSRPTVQALSALFTALVSPQRISSLQSFALVSPTADELTKESNESEVVTHTGLSHDIFLPLTHLSRLCRLEIDIDQCFIIGDNDLMSLVRHWPLLQIFKLYGCRGPHTHLRQPGKYITFKGLLPLLEHCPELHQLSISLDAREVPVDTPERIVCNPAMRLVTFLDSPISSPELVLHFLNRHFPSVTRLRTSFYDPSIYQVDESDLYHRTWKLVGNYLHEFQRS